jgi:hypothetical protein
VNPYGRKRAVEPKAQLVILGETPLGVFSGMTIRRLPNPMRTEPLRWLVGLIGLAVVTDLPAFSQTKRGYTPPPKSAAAVAGVHFERGTSVGPEFVARFRRCDPATRAPRVSTR